jgi:RNA polymerase sigma-70 factor, ECF subfamily
VRQPAADDSAFERYVLPEIEVLLRVAHSLTRNHAEAEDLVQDTLLRAYRGIGGLTVATRGRGC